MERGGIIAQVGIRWDRRRRGLTMRAPRLVWAVAFAGMGNGAGTAFIRVSERSMRDRFSALHHRRAAGFAVSTAILKLELHDVELVLQSRPDHPCGHTNNRTDFSLSLDTPFHQEQNERRGGYSRGWNPRKMTCIHGQLIHLVPASCILIDSFQWSSRGKPVNLIDKRPDVLEAAMLQIEKFRATVGKDTGHKGGLVTTFVSDDLKHALQGAWLAVEVRRTS